MVQRLLSEYFLFYIQISVSTKPKEAAEVLYVTKLLSTVWVQRQRPSWPLWTLLYSHPSQPPVGEPGQLQKVAEASGVTDCG